MAVHRSISVEQNLKIKMPRDIFKILFGRGIGLHPLVTATVDILWTGGRYDADTSVYNNYNVSPLP